MCNAILRKAQAQGGRFSMSKRPKARHSSIVLCDHSCEKIVLRILNRMSSVLNLEEVGMLPRMLKRFREDVLEPSQRVMITTGRPDRENYDRYSCINYIKTPYSSIITAEDPVEYIIDGSLNARSIQASISPMKRPFGISFDRPGRDWLGKSG